MKTILKTIVGSQAHGLATPKSDFDYRGVFLVPTSEFMKLGGTMKTTSWVEGNDDDTSWEVGHFLNMAVHCNPTVLETFLAPVDEADFWGEELRTLFSYVWNSTDVMNAFIGYGINQRTKFFKNQDNRAPKYAAAYLRVLFNAQELLNTGTFTVNLKDTEIYEQVKRFKNGEYEVGEVIQACFEMETRVLKAHQKNPNKKTEFKPINDFLLKIRKANW